MSADFREPLTLLISAHLRALSVPTFGVIVELWRINAGPIKVSMEKASVPGHKFCKKFGAATIRLGDSANSLGGCSCEVENRVVFWALWELPWNRLQKPLACPAKSLKTLGGVLNPVSFSQQFPKSRFLLAAHDKPILEQIARRRTLPWFQVQRARAVLAIAEGARIQTVAFPMQCDPSTVWRLCRRYEEAGLEGGLARVVRGGHPTGIFPPQRAPVVA